MRAQLLSFFAIFYVFLNYKYIVEFINDQLYKNKVHKYEQICK